MNSTVQTETTRVPEFSSPDAGLRCELVVEFARLQELSHGWESFLSADAQAEIFYTWDWARAVWAAYGKTHELCTPVVYEADRLLGILPLVRVGKTLRFLAGPESDYNDILCADADAARVIVAAFEALLRVEGWNRCIFDNLSAQSRLLRHLPELPKPLRGRLQAIFQCPASGVNLTQDRDAQLTKIIRKQQLRRAQNKLERLGTLRFRHLETKSEIREHLPHFFRQHTCRHAMNGVPSHFLQSECRSFYEALADELDPRTSLRFSVLELNGDPLAYHFGFQKNGKFLMYQPTFDIRYWDCCPGDALMRFLFRYAQQEGVSNFDFSIGGEHYKARYTNYEIWTYTLFFDRSPRSARALFQRGSRRAREFVRLKPKLANALRSVLRRLKLSLMRGRRIATRRGMQGVVRQLAAFVANAGYRREEITVLTASAPAVPAAPAAKDAALFTAGLDELAMLSLDYPEYLTEARLLESRLRLKQGDRLHIWRDHGQAHVIWVGERSELQLAKGRGVPFGASVSLIYDWWTVPGATGKARVDPSRLRALLEEEAGHEIWACSSGEDIDEFVKAGFAPKYKIQALSFLNRIWRIQGPLACGAEVDRSC